MVLGHLLIEAAWSSSFHLDLFARRLARWTLLPEMVALRAWQRVWRELAVSPEPQQLVLPEQLGQEEARVLPGQVHLELAVEAAPREQAYLLAQRRPKAERQRLWEDRSNGRG
jgi:hypothetical protein